MNCDDMLLALERKQMKAEAEKMQKIKKELQSRERLVENAKRILNNSGGPARKPEFDICIKYVTGNKTVVGRLPDVKKQWEKCKYMCPHAAEKKWTTENHDAKLEKLEIGDISCVEDTVLYIQTS